MSATNFEATRVSNLTNLFHVTYPEPGMKVLVQLFWGPAHLKFCMAKNIQNSAQFRKI